MKSKIINDIKKCRNISELENYLLENCSRELLNSTVEKFSPFEAKNNFNYYKSRILKNQIVDPKEIIGTEHCDYYNMTLEKEFKSLKRKNDVLNRLLNTPEYFYSTYNVPEEEDMPSYHRIVMNNSKNIYYAESGNHRTTVSRILKDIDDTLLIKGVIIIDWEIDWELEENIKECKEFFLLHGLKLNLKYKYLSISDNAFESKVIEGFFLYDVNSKEFINSENKYSMDEVKELLSSPQKIFAELLTKGQRIVLTAKRKLNKIFNSYSLN